MNINAIQHLRAPGLSLGTWLGLGSPVIAELAAECGFDWVLFDLEHGFGGEDLLLAQLLALRGSATAGVVRLGAPHPDQIQRVLDRGADAIMFPRIGSAAQAEACVAAAHYPPRGRRGYSRSTRPYRYGLSTESVPTPVIMAQIETIEGVRNAAAIAAVDGVDVLFVGPSDLRFDLKSRPGDAPGDADACIDLVCQAAAAHGKQTGILLRDADDPAAYQRRGFTIIAIDSDLGILRSHYQKLRTQR